MENIREICSSLEYNSMAESNYLRGLKQVELVPCGAFFNSDLSNFHKIDKFNEFKK